MALKLTMLIFSLTCSVAVLGAQTFTPLNGVTYPVEIVEWTINGEDRFPAMKSNLRTCTIIFNSDNTEVSFGSALYNATYIFFPNGSYDFSVRALFIRRSGSGMGRVERSGRELTLFVSMRAEREDVSAVIRGYM